MATVTACIDEETQCKREQPSKAVDRSRSWLVADAIKRYVDEESWQIAAIEEGVQQAGASDFASTDGARAAFGRWGGDAR